MLSMLGYGLNMVNQINVKTKIAPKKVLLINGQMFLVGILETKKTGNNFVPRVIRCMTTNQVHFAVGGMN